MVLVFGACQNVEPQAPVNDEFVINLTAYIDDVPSTRTVYVPDGSKVNWVAGDKINARYPAANGKYPASLTLASGAGSTNATFTGKLAASATYVPASKPSDFVFYYPTVTNADDRGVVTDADNFTINNKFPKIQNSADILFEPNWMVGTAKAQDLLDVAGQDYKMEFAVSMKNLMGLLDFTVKGSGNLKRIFVTDLDESAPALYGDETLVVKDGAIESLTLNGTASSAADRTIIAEFSKPVALTEAGAHVYVTIFPRRFAKGVRIGFETETGECMVRTLAENVGFEIVSSKVYQVPEIVFTPSMDSGKGYYDGVEYSYEKFVDSRDGNEYKVATLKDGRTWMLQGLRYMPDGISNPAFSLSEVNAGVWYPVVMKADGTGVQFGSTTDISRYGFCYNFSTAMGKAPDYAYNLLKEILAGTKTQAEVLAELKSLEGKQGICPDGWHVPTQVEYNALYSVSGSSLSGLGIQGFVLKDQGAVMVNNPSATSDPAAGTFMGYASNKLNTCYYMLSTPNAYNNLKAIMPNVTNNTAAVANMNIRCGAPLRCIKDN